MRLKDKVALITGGSSGIGRETALLFATEGASIIVVDLNDAAGAKVVDEIKAAGSKAVYVHADVLTGMNHCQFACHRKHSALAGGVGQLRSRRPQDRYE